MCPFLFFWVSFSFSLLEIFFKLHLAALCDLDRGTGLVALIRRHSTHHLNNILATLNSAEDDVLAIQMSCGFESYEKLGAVSVRASVCH